MIQKLEIFVINKNNAFRINGILLIFLSILIAQSCRPTKYVPEDEYLLQKSKIRIDKKKEIPKKDLKSYIRQKPNKRILGVRFHLGLYNLSNLEKEKGMSKWLRKIGEPPVIFDEHQDARSVKQLGSYLEQKGYFEAVVSDSVWFVKKKAYVEYAVTANEPHKLNKIKFRVDDPVISPFIFKDTSNTLLKQGDNYDVETLELERTRIEKLLKNNGFYNFQKDYVNFVADSTVGDHLIDMTIHVKPLTIRQAGNISKEVHFRKYRIRNVYFFADYDPAEALKNPSTYYNYLDTTIHQDFYFVVKEKPVVHYDVVLKANYISPGGLYNLTDVKQTQKHLSGLNVIKLVDIYFTEVPQNHVSDTGTLILDCHVQIASNRLQAYSIELEGTNSSGNFGASVNLLYQHRNLFRKAEVLNLKLKNLYEALPQEEKGFSSVYELGIGADLVFPRFLLPFLEKEEFVKKFNPKTSLFTAYNYQRRPEYVRTIVTTSFGYKWQANKNISHIVTPIDLNAIKLPYIDSAWAEYIDTTSYLAYSYKDAFIAGLSYSLILTNFDISKKRDYYFMRLNITTSGNLVHLLNKTFNKSAQTEGNKIFGIEYSQFFMWDVDMRYHTVINEANSIVYRAFFGIGLPYGNSRALPFEKQYFTGGANDIRAWPVRSLGPGSFVQTKTNFYNQTADLKIVANLEYRFKVFWVLEGALFLDMGNIWAVSKEDDRPGALFTKTFYDDLAIGTGIGARLNFSFFLFRLDFGFKMRDPQIEDSNKWVFLNNNYGRKDITLHLAVGYPF